MLLFYGFLNLSIHQISKSAAKVRYCIGKKQVFFKKNKKKTQNKIESLFPSFNAAFFLIFFSIIDLNCSLFSKKCYPPVFADFFLRFLAFFRFYTGG